MFNQSTCIKTFEPDGGGFHNWCPPPLQMFDTQFSQGKPDCYYDQLVFCLSSVHIWPQHYRWHAAMKFIQIANVKGI